MTSPSLSEQIEWVKRQAEYAAQQPSLYAWETEETKTRYHRAVLQSLEVMQKLEEAARAVTEADDAARVPEDLTKVFDAIYALRAALPDPPAAAETPKK